MAACVTILLLILLLNLAYFSAVRFRLVPKIRARFVDKTPYEDIVITEQGTNQGEVTFIVAFLMEGPGFANHIFPKARVAANKNAHSL